MSVPRLSLVVATRGRVAELDALLASVAIQQGPACEVIVVDQNDDGRLDRLLAGWAGRLALSRVKSPVAALSHARNLALALCRGDLVAFPDDDCAYPPGVLAAVDAAFAADPALDGLTGAAATPQGGFGSGRWQDGAGPVDRGNVWITAISFTIFLRRDLWARLGGFDERLGIGARFGAAEETDLLIRALEAGARIRYDPTLRVLHPDKRLTETAVRRARAYAMGCGFVLGRHRYPPTTVLTFLARPLGGLLLGLLRLRMREVRYYARTLAGRIAGYRAASRR